LQCPVVDEDVSSEREPSRVLGGALGPPSELQNGLCGSWTFQPHLAGDDADGGQIERRGLASWFRRFFFSTGGTKD
jgi:hypothetical protein